MTAALVVAAALAAATTQAARWLRVAQREHYRPGAATLFARRWWAAAPNPPLAAAAAAATAAAAAAPLAGLAAAAALVAGPAGLGLRGRTAPLAWTRRLRTVAGVWAGAHLALVAAGAAAGAAVPAALVAAAATPLVVDGALAALAPLERRLGRGWAARAAERLRRVGPTTVAVTGSYGKTTTKGYVAHLAAATATVVASPASFNNRSGLARAVNEHLAPGTEVFVAEMGTYGRGEIAELCRWFPPQVAVICAIGPVHLERMGSEDAIAAAKAEILSTGAVAVLNVDHPALAALAGAQAAAGRRVWRCSAVDPAADVAVVGGRLRVAGRDVAGVDDPSVHPGNLACAAAVALELGVPEAALAERLGSLPTPPHRRSVSVAPSGAVVVDDTYNANPAGAAAALAALAGQGGGGGRRVVVTPGMVELGARQGEENRRFAAAAAAAATHLVVVGRTNRRALLDGAAAGPAEVVAVATREQAVAWVRQHVGEGDAVLYENDLPDHFP